MQEQDASGDQNEFSTVGIAREKQLSYSEKTTGEYNHNKTPHQS